MQLFERRYLDAYLSFLPRPSAMYAMFRKLIDKAHGYGVARDDDVVTYVKYGVILDSDFDQDPDFHERLIKIKTGEQSAAEALDFPMSAVIDFNKWRNRGKTLAQ
ncbi:hypothetical protein WK76_25105 [Burkholderia ubonensis]|nr:hypothetical protein WK76_25105 [Burkholderia ubonensis]